MRVLICLLASFGVVTLVLVALEEMVRWQIKPEKDNIYKLCERYIALSNDGCGYWLTDTEIQLHEELEEHLKHLKIIK